MTNITEAVFVSRIEEKINITLEEDFLQEEIRDDFTVTEERKKIWAIQMDLLHELLEVCKVHDIKISIFAGSLLGVVRHKGFIPWDDDIDVCLTRENYERLLSIAPKAFSGRYFFQTALTDQKFFIGYARLRNSETTGIIKWNNSRDYNNGIYIDIFPLDGYTESEKKLKLQLALVSMIQKLCNSYYFDCSIEKGIRQMAIRLLQKTIFKVIPYTSLVALYNKLLQLYSSEERVSLLTHSEQFIRKYWCEKEDLENLTLAKFENLYVPVPENYDAMLIHMYGDYMKFPPIEQRGAWHGDSLTINPDISYLEYFDEQRKKEK